MFNLKSYKPLIVLTSSTIAFTVCFMVWVIFAVIGISIKKKLGLNELEFGLLISTPILSGSLVRVPLGILTDRVGGRLVFILLIILTIPSLFLLSYAKEYWHFLVIGLFVGLAGGSFSVGTPYVARWFPKNKQGLAMGIFGAGNAGSSLTKLIAPSLVIAYGWEFVPKAYAFLLLITLSLFIIFSYSDKSHIISSNVKLKDQLSLIFNPRVLLYSQYYSVVFGGYVALALWITHHYTEVYDIPLATAGMLAAAFSLPGGVLRAFGGFVSDKFGAYRVTLFVFIGCFIIFLILSIPSTEIINVYVCSILLFIAGFLMAFGKASVFKFISDEFLDEVGTVSGIVGLVGGLGGFVLPVIFGILIDITHAYSVIFLLMAGTCVVSLYFLIRQFYKKI